MSSSTDDDNYKTTRPLETRIGLHQQFSINPYGWHRWMLDQLPLTPGISIVELGCGTGELWTAAQGNELDGVELFLFDKSSAMLETAKGKLSDIKNVHFDFVDLDTDFKLPKVPDILIANHVLYHAKNPSATLSKLPDQVNQTTQCVFATNGMASMESLTRFLPERLRVKPLYSLIENFTLESGYQVVLGVFGSAKTHRYSDGLHITEAAPLVEYIQSLPFNIESHELDETAALIDAHIRNYGSVFIEKDTGFITTTTP